MKPVLIDSGVIVALLDRRDKRHAECVAAVEALDNPLITCESVISESCYLLRRLSGAAESVLANVEEGLIGVDFDFAESVPPVRAILHKYRDVPADFADACLIHMADLLDSGDILTLDSDFVTYRWRRNRPFNLLIPLQG